MSSTGSTLIPDGSNVGLSDFILTDSVSQQRSLGCPHGFESCTEYRIRMYYAVHPAMNGRVVVTYIKDDPEDRLHIQLMNIIDDKQAASDALKNGSKEFLCKRLGKLIPLCDAYLFWQSQDTAFNNVQRRLFEIVDKRAADPGKCSLLRVRAG